MRSLVLSGGGSKGAFQVGVLKKWMLEDGTDYDLIAGISVGAITTGILGQWPKGDPAASWNHLNDVWKQVENAKIKKSWFPFGVLEALWQPSVYNSQPLQDWIKSGMDQVKLTSSGRQLRIVAVSWDTGESRVITEKDPNIPSWVIASCAYPAFLTPITIDNQLWTDGGLRSVTPLGEAIRAGATDIDVIITADPNAPMPFTGKPRVLPDLALRAIEVMANEIMRADLKLAGLKNDLAGPYKVVNIRIAYPKVSLDGYDALDFSQDKIQEMVKIGYDSAVSLG